MTTNTNAVLVAALEAANRAINSMKVEAETAAQGDEQMMLEACEQISNEGLEASEAIRAALSTAAAQPAAPRRDALPAEDVRELAAIGRAVNRAAIDLPQGARIQIELECGAGTAYWLDDAKGAWRHIEGSGELFSVQINAAIDAARAQVASGQPPA